MTDNEHIDALMHALPTVAVIAAASDEDLERFRRIANILANMAFREISKRQEKQP